MSIICDGCGKPNFKVAVVIEFEVNGIALHLCDECIDTAKKACDEFKENSEMLGSDES